MKILFATDGTKQSFAAVELLQKFAFSEQSEIKLISIIDMAIPLSLNIYEGFLPNTVEIENTAKENAKKFLEETQTILATTFPNLTITTEILIGAPEIKIVEKAEEMVADLIVVGSHGYNRWERLLLGSVSDSVIHHAPCSVLVVRN